MEERLEELKKQLVDVLTELDKIKPVQFLDVECENCVYNYGGVDIHEGDNRVYVELLMFHDNLPSHKDNPLKDGRGSLMLPL